MSHTTDKELNDAANLLCRYAETHLPAGFRVELVMYQDEASLECFDPDDTPVEFQSGDCAMREACEASHHSYDPNGRTVWRLPNTPATTNGAEGLYYDENGVQYAEIW